MNINYKRLFNIKLHHSYYKDDLARDDYLVVGRDTEKLINKGRMLLKATPGETVVLFRASEDGSTPLIELGKDQKFTFGIKAGNPPEFLNITELDEHENKKFKSSNIAYFKNDPGNASSDPDNPEELVHEIIGSLRPLLFTYEFSLNNNPSQVLMEVADTSGNLIFAYEKMADATGIFSQQVDLREKPPGKYSITIKDLNDGAELKADSIFADDYFAGQNLIGILEIIYDATSGHLYGDIEQYALKFSRKQTIWKYFIVDKNGQVDITDTLSVIDESTGAEQAYAQNTFAMEGDQPHADIRINGLDTVIFKSNELIPFFEMPKLNLALKNSSGTKILQHLPNPYPGGVVKEIEGVSASEVYVFI